MTAARPPGAGAARVGSERTDGLVSVAVLVPNQLQVPYPPERAPQLLSEERLAWFLPRSGHDGHGVPGSCNSYKMRQTARGFGTIRGSQTP